MAGKGFNFATIGKIFADTFHFNLTETGLFLGFQSGPHVHGFVIPLALAKMLRDALDKGIQEFEAKNGEIDTSGNTSGVLSDIQPG